MAFPKKVMCFFHLTDSEVLPLCWHICFTREASLASTTSTSAHHMELLTQTHKIPLSIMIIFQN